MITSTHNSKDLDIVAGITPSGNTKFIYTFENFFHPFVGELIEKLNNESLTGMLDAKWQKEQKTLFFHQTYDLGTLVPIDRAAKVESFPKEFDVSGHGPYSNYNWELFFHIPLAIATHLSKNQRFAEAQRWFHFIFDPTSNDTSAPLPDRFWKFLAFRNGGDLTQIDELLALLASGLGPVEIARDLAISPKTVATHIQRMLTKLGVHSRAQAVAVALRDQVLGS
jgi:DNA-binding CsgD family transcriptional regulator